MVYCEYCRSDRFRDEEGLAKHQATHRLCSVLKRKAEGNQNTPAPRKLNREDEDSQDALLLNQDQSPHDTPPTPAGKQGQTFREVHAVEQHDVDAVTQQISAFYDDSYLSEEENESKRESRFQKVLDKIANSEEAGTDSEGSDSDPEDEESYYVCSDDEADYKEVPEQPEPGSKPPNSQIRDDFREYCKAAPMKFMPFTS